MSKNSQKKSENSYNFKKSMLYELWRNNSIRQNLSKVTKEKKAEYQKEYEKDLEAIKEIKSLQNRKKTIYKNIEKKKLTHYGTITLGGLKRKADEKKVRTSLTMMLKRYQIPYVMVHEYQDDGTIHFHGFFGNFTAENLVIARKNGKTLPPNKYGKIRYNFEPISKNYGFNVFYKLEEKEDEELSRMVNYTAKYILKTGNKIMSSRFKIKECEKH